MTRTVWTCMLGGIKYIPDTYDFTLILYVSDCTKPRQVFSVLHGLMGDLSPF